MKSGRMIVVVLALVQIGRADDAADDAPVSALKLANLKSIPVVKLSDDELTRLLDGRVGGDMGMTFAQFGNMFFVKSRLDLGVSIGLMSHEKSIVKSQLQSPFPESYHPTLREFLNAIALQTFSEWQYDATGKFLRGEFETRGPVKDIVIFEFTLVKREKPFKVKLAEDWKLIDKGNWVMYVPPDFPVGMDIYEMGSYSIDEKDKSVEEDKTAFLARIRQNVALEWARRVHPEADEEDLKPAKVGQYDALYFEKLLKGNGKKIRWRHWVFMVEDRCYFIVSTILPNLEEVIFPDVKEMIESFTIEDPKR